MSQSGKMSSIRGETIPHKPGRLRIPVWRLIALMALLACLGGFAAYGFDENGLRFGSQLAWRFACLVYFAAITAGPLSRLIPWETLRRVAKERHQLVWGFCASFGVYIASLIVPNTLTPASLDHEGMTIGMALFALFGAVLTMVIAYTATRPRNLGESRRAILGVGLSYFWLTYTLTALSHLSGPDGFYGISLILMLVALLVRFAGNFAAKMRPQEEASRS